jgi:hypothetical protein
VVSLQTHGCIFSGLAAISTPDVRGEIQLFGCFGGADLFSAGMLTEFHTVIGYCFF